LPRSSDLDDQARGFAKNLTDLLNRTVTDGIPLSSVLRDDGHIGWVGYGITKQNFAPGRLIPLKLSKGPPACFLHIHMTLHLDAEIQRLVVQRSTSRVYCHDDDFRSLVFHYDYDREPENDYPNPHFQVAGGNEHLDQLCNRAGVEKSLPDLHFPVGGRRYRPSIEDVIEFLVVESLAPGRPGWEAAVAEHRRTWERIQLRSVVRRDQQTAAEELAARGWRLEPPSEERQA
jgi:hypothetical protein